MITCCYQKLIGSDNEARMLINNYLKSKPVDSGSINRFIFGESENGCAKINL